MANKAQPEAQTAQAKLEMLVEQAIDVARKARKHRKPLTGENFYADKMAELRADASNCFRDLSSHPIGDVSALAEMVQVAFSATANSTTRTSNARELLFALRTTWREAPMSPAKGEEDSIFPLSLLSPTKRGYLVTIARQMNGCFAAGWYDAAAVMMRRLLETSIIEAYEGRRIESKIKNSKGEFLQLSDLIQNALNETSWNLSRNAQSALPRLRDVGHLSAHSRYFHAQKSDIEKVSQGCRIVVEEFLHLAGLL